MRHQLSYTGKAKRTASDRSLAVRGQWRGCGWLSLWDVLDDAGGDIASTFHDTAYPDLPAYFKVLEVDPNVDAVITVFE